MRDETNRARASSGACNAALGSHDSHEPYGGHYVIPRPCVCGQSHLDRATYWKHRLEAEAKK